MIFDSEISKQEIREENSKFSNTVSSSFTAAACPRNSISLRYSSPIALPRQRTSPSAGRVSPASVRSNVVLPLPLAPRTRSRPPACSAKPRSENRRSPPRSQASAVVSSMPLILLGNLRALRDASLRYPAPRKVVSCAPCKTAGWFLFSTSGTCLTTSPCWSFRPRWSQSGASGAGLTPNYCRWRWAASLRSASAPFRRAGSRTTGAATR